jgi:hypothetical protein
MRLFFSVFSILTLVQIGVAETLVFGESYRTIKKDSAYQTDDVLVQKGVHRYLGLFAWGQYATGYQQTYGGFYLKPTSWLQVGTALGEEMLHSRPRLGTFLYAEKWRINTFCVYENLGATGYWYMAHSDFRLNERWGVGTHSQSFFGHGPRVEFRLKTVRGWTPSIRTALGWERVTGIRPNTIIGLRFTYFKRE